MIDWKWNFSKKNDPERNLLDPFSDSKFGIDSIASFTREIIQNSLDAHNDEVNKPVKVVFQTLKVKANSVPGINQLISTLENAIKNIKHPETINKFKRAIESLKKEEIEILKTSDYNTIGMDKNKWAALLFKEGVSDKQNDSSAGRHGVGKKASFLMSLCNTVYYSTMNKKGDRFFSGKSVLVDWENEEGVWHSKTGWYGLKNGNDVDYLINDDLNIINDVFTRKDSFGSDVIVLTPRIIDEEYTLDKRIINSVLENFYIGLAEEKLTVQVNDIIINSINVDRILNDYYIDQFKRQAISGSNITYGLLRDFRKAYIDNLDNPIRINIDKLNSHLDLYLTLETNKAKKYYSFYRDHGMKIKDVRFSDADKTFSAVVIARGKQLNEFLLGLENAAHDDFIIDENLDIEKKKEYKNLLDYINDMIEYKIRQLTKLEISDEIELNELNEIIDNPGEINRHTNKKNQTPKKKNEQKITVQLKSEKKTEEEWKDRIKPLDPVPIIPDKPVNPDTPPRPLPYSIENEEEDSEEKKVLREVQFEKLLVVLQDCYYMQFRCEYNLKRVSIQVTAKNVDDSENEVGYMLEEISWNNKIYKNKNKNYIELGDLDANCEMKLFIKLRDASRYKLFARIVGKTYD